MPRWLNAAASIGWRLIVIAVVAYGVAIVIASLRLLIVPATLSLFVACLVTPLVVRLREGGFGRLVSTLMVSVGAVGSLALVVWFIAAQVDNSLAEIGESVESGIEQFSEFLADGPFGLTPERINELVDQGTTSLTENLEGLIGGVAGGAITLLEVIAGFLLTLVFAFFVIKDGDRFWDWLLEFVDEGRRSSIDRIGEKAWSTLRAYLGGTALVGVADAVLISIGLLVMGVPLVLPLALLIFFGAFFPLVGATVSGAIAALVALATVGWIEALIVAGIVLVVQQVEGDVLMPLLLGRAVDLHPLLILSALTIGFLLAGLVGGFLAVPLVAVAIVVIKEVRQQNVTVGDSPEPQA